LCHSRSAFFAKRWHFLQEFDIFGKWSVFLAKVWHFWLEFGIFGKSSAYLAQVQCFWFKLGNFFLPICHDPLPINSLTFLHCIYFTLFNCLFLQQWDLVTRLNKTSVCLLISGRFSPLKKGHCMFESFIASWLVRHAIFFSLYEHPQSISGSLPTYNMN